MRPRQHGHTTGDGFSRILSTVRQKAFSDHGYIRQSGPVPQFPCRIRDVANMIFQGFRNLAISPQHALPALGLQFPHHGMAAFRMPGHVDDGGTHAHGFKPPDIPLVLYAHRVKEGKIIL